MIGPRTFLCVLLTGGLLLSGTYAATSGAALIPAGARKAAPAFQLVDGAGKLVRLSDFKGKPVVLNFWATECGGCVLEIPTFIRLNQAYQDKGVQVVGLSMDVMYESLKNASEGWARVKPFVAKRQLSYSILMGDDEVSKSYHVEALPITHLIDRSGRIAASYVGVLVNEQDLESNVRKLIAER